MHPYYGAWTPNNGAKERYFGGVAEYPSVGTRLRRPVPIPARFLPETRGWRRRPPVSPLVVAQAQWLAWHEGVADAQPCPVQATIDRQRAWLAQEVA